MPIRKNPVGSIQVEPGTVEKEREGEVSGVRISSRGGIICNTRKM